MRPDRSRDIGVATSVTYGLRCRSKRSILQHPRHGSITNIPLALMSLHAQRRCMTSLANANCRLFFNLCRQRL
ncbi:MAG: hypothetical protein ACYDAE_11135 [Steroidobacteraceae bacterium]